MHRGAAVLPQLQTSSGISVIDIGLPTDPSGFADAEWSDVSPFFDQLMEAPLDLENATEWLATWSRLEELVGEAATVAMNRYTANTADAEARAAHIRFSTTIYPQMQERQSELSRRFLALGWTRPDADVMLSEMRTDVELFREENVPLFAELEELDAKYQELTGGLGVDWDGERRTIPQLQPFLKSPDRSVRERAFRAGMGAYLGNREELADIFDRMYELRQAVARNAGFPDYEKYVFRAKHRVGYGPDDCRRFHDAVVEAVVPVAGRLLERRRRRLGLTTVRPWDLGVDPDGAEPLKPFETVSEFIERGERVFGGVDSQFGAFFRTMAEEGLLDLESRPGKAPGGYCTTLPFKGMPYVFMNAVGVPDDVNTLVHEAGHCFHAFLAQPQPFIWQRGTGSEAAELASMSMELLAMPHLERPSGYYEPQDVRRAWVEHLEDIVFALPHIASVDAFQSWIYTSGKGHDRDERDRAWLEIRSRFEPDVDWSDLDAERTARWYRQLHIFLYPFYYIEYGIAQLGALQVWRDSMADYRSAVNRYKAALALGGTRPLPEIYSSAGAKLVFDAAEMSALMELVERQVEMLEG